MIDDDINTLADLVAKGINGTVEFGMMNGLQLKDALTKVNKAKRNGDAAKALLRQLCLTNPILASQIEASCENNPMVKAFAERMGILPKDATVR